MKYLPVFVDVRGVLAVVIGGGTVAERKIELLLRCEASVRCIAPGVTTRLRGWIDAGRVQHVERRFDSTDLDSARLVIAASSDQDVNGAVARLARARGVLVNVVDQPEQCSFIVPAIVDRSPLQIAVSTGGASPVLARWVRACIEALLDSSWGRLAGFAERFRERVRERLTDAGARRRFWDGVFTGVIAQSLRRGREAEAERRLNEALDAAQAEPAGHVTLVGAGPGDPGLLTLNALRALQQADVVLHDRLVSDEVLELARRDAELVPVGKSAGGGGATQEQINEQLVAQARRGRRVVRLKGGDPFVFGRGGEELEHLRAAGVEFDVVPGVTAALACAAYAGIPVTHREQARSIALATAHTANAIAGIDLARLAGDDRTLALYMGIGQAAELERKFLKAGFSGSLPVAIVENGTRPEQRVVLARIDELAAAVHKLAIVSPALIIVGHSVEKAAHLHWFGSEPHRYAA